MAYLKQRVTTVIDRKFKLNAHVNEIILFKEGNKNYFLQIMSSEPPTEAIVTGKKIC